MDIAELTLPAGTHAELLRATDVNNQPIHRIVMWADRPYDRCPSCGEPVRREVDQCPVTLNGGACAGGQLDAYSQQHGCGEWLHVLWHTVSSADVVPDAAQTMALALKSTVETERERIRKGLREDLTHALERLAEPLGPGEELQEREEDVRTGSDVDPGVCRENGSSGPWIAWDNDPSGDGDVITVTEHELNANA